MCSKLEAVSSRFPEGDRELRTEVLRSRFGNLEVAAAIVGLDALLLADVFLDYFVRHIAA